MLLRYKYNGTCETIVIIHTVLLSMLQCYNGTCETIVVIHTVLLSSACLRTQYI